MKLCARFLFCFVVAACGSPPEGNSNTDVDAGTQQPDSAVVTGCANDSECTAQAPICTANGTCVECESSAECPDDRPVCGNGACQASCAGEEVTADFVTLPSDIIWVVDQSGSMDQETQYVQQQINTFANAISSSGIDYRVVMIARDSGTNAICVPAPLGGAACGDNTRFKLVDQYVDSRNGPAVAVAQYPNYSSFLRQNAMKHFIFVTDDDSNQSAATFTNGLAALTPAGMFATYKVHGIYGRSSTGGTCTGAFGSAVRAGAVYTTLITQTGGASGVICDNDWTNVFTQIQAAVVSGSQVSCEINVPTPSGGGSIDPNQVNVKYVMGGVGSGTTLPQAANAAACTASGGWYYDDPSAPTKITLCPATCTAVQADAAASVKLELGCSTVIL
jgi:hypothetical protein